MSRDKKNRDKPNTHENCVTVERDQARQSALRLKKENDKWESKQTFEVIRVDAKTTIYRRTTPSKANSVEIHKGRI